MSLAHFLTTTTFILGSGSWSRRTILADIIPTFATACADIDESAIRDADARKLVLLLGRAKADALIDSSALSAAVSSLPKRPCSLLITGDSVVTHKGQILEKPSSKGEARRFLESYATGPATTVSSVVVTDLESGARWEGVAEAEVHFRKMPDDVIEELIETGGSMESAGGLRIEHPKVERYTDYVLGEKSAVMGFSKGLVEDLLLKATGSRGEGQ
eukprot:Plantae.Rhodophyta-Palmaria_palmata.ctg9586.p1 GENE.Plantae.Rhodophyta-Palmaria_palmata.ctg9586~~Plantae.Rhodophyta-Palmaria_palmata.ctg9586.p1  ORF type:complete len:216 (+),score=32.18 Plantae.Rhodophyta-Palmaria_palmata.ctg9586:36-683(+)